MQSCIWLFCWAALLSSTSLWASSWLSPLSLWLPLSHPMSRSRTKKQGIVKHSVTLTLTKHILSLPLFKGSVCLRSGLPQPGLYPPLFCFLLPRASGNASLFPRWMDTLPVSHLSGHTRPLPLWFFSLPSNSLVGLPLLVAVLEHSVLEVSSEEQLRKMKTPL